MGLPASQNHPIGYWVYFNGFSVSMDKFRSMLKITDNIGGAHVPCAVEQDALLFNT
jgi:hypothetical protein